MKIIYNIFNLDHKNKRQVKIKLNLITLKKGTLGTYMIKYGTVREECEHIAVKVLNDLNLNRSLGEYSVLRASIINTLE